MSRTKTIPIEVGSTNVYVDLGYADAAEMQRKSQLAAEIARAIKARHLTQDAAAELLGISVRTLRNKLNGPGKDSDDE